MQLDIPLLKSYIAVVECGGFTRAAERLNLTQSAVSLQVRRLEQEAGCRLLKRNSRRVALTPDGEVLLSYAHRIVALHDEAGLRLGGAVLSGLVRFGAPDYVAAHHLPRLLARFHRGHPNVLLEMTTGRSAEIRQKFRAGELDLAIAARPVGVADGLLLWSEPRVWTTADFVDLHPHGTVPLALFPSGCLSRKAGLEALDRSGRPWRIVYTGSSAACLKAAALAGLGVTILPFSELDTGMKVMGPEVGLPLLPDLEFALFGELTHASDAVRRLAELLLGALQRPGAA